MITGIILASGLSRRMKKDKLLIQLGEKTIIEHVVETCANSDLDKVILVYRKEEVKLIGEKYKIDTVYNENSNLGQSESMKLGLIRTQKRSSFMFIMGDQPFINPDLINKLITEYKNSKLPILIPYYNNTRGMPIIMGAEYREELLKVKGDKGGREIVKRDHLNVHKIYIDDQKLGIDIDTEKDLKEVKKWI